MRLAVVCPIGRLDRYGYQHMAPACMASFERLGAVFYASTTRANRNDLTAGVVSDERTWFDRLPDGSEHFSVHRIVTATNVVTGDLASLGYEAVVDLHCNNYLTEEAAVYLEEKAAEMVRNGQPWGWVYRRDQLADRLTGTTVRLPRMINLTLKPWPWVAADAMGLADQQIAKVERGHWQGMDRVAVVDVQLEMPLQDLADKMNYLRCYHDLLPKRKPEFDWGFWKGYYVDKFRKKPMTKDAAPVPSRPDFVSWEILRAL